MQHDHVIHSRIRAKQQCGRETRLLACKLQHLLDIAAPKPPRSVAALDTFAFASTRFAKGSKLCTLYLGGSRNWGKSNIVGEEVGVRPRCKMMELRCETFQPDFELNANFARARVDSD